MKTSQKTLMVGMLLILALFGGALIYFTMEYLAAVAQDDAPPTPVTFQQVELIFLVVTIMAGFPAVGMGAYVMYIGSRIYATGQWPPAGLGFKSKVPLELGIRSNLAGVGTMGLGGIITLIGLSLPLFGLSIMNMFGE